MPIYDAFISYSHAKDKPIAAALQSIMQTLGKPWYRDRALRIFRDDTSLSATPHLWPSIEKALSQARYLMLLASPEAAKSPWIAKEVEYWLNHKSADTLFIGLTHGDLAWDSKKADFRWKRETPLPKALKGRFASEPRWVDLRPYRQTPDQRNAKLTDLGADFAAAIHGMPKEDLLSEELRQQRRASRLATGAAASLLVLAVAAIWQWRTAEFQRSEAVTAKKEAQTQAAVADEQRKLAETNEQIAKEQKGLAEERALEARLRAQAAEARVLQATDPGAALKRSAQTMKENLDSGRPILPEIQSSLFETLNVARQVKRVDSTPDTAFPGIKSIAISPDDRMIAVGTPDLVVILDRAGHLAAAPITGPDGHETHANQLAWDDAGEILAVASGGIFNGEPTNAALRLYNRKGELVRTLVERYKSPILSVSFVPRQGTIVAGDADGDLIQADPRSGETRILASGRKGAITGLAFSSSSLVLAIEPKLDLISRGFEEEHSNNKPVRGSATDTSSEVSTAIGRPLEFVSDSSATGLLCISAKPPWAYYIATCGADGTTNVWMLDSAGGPLELEQSLRGHIGPVRAIAWNAKGTILATGGEDGEIRLWSEDGAPLSPPLQTGARSGGRATQALAFTKDGKQLLSGSADGRLIFWDVADIGGQAFSSLGYADRAFPAANYGESLLARTDKGGRWRLIRITAGDPPEWTERPLGIPNIDPAPDFVFSSNASLVAWTEGKVARVREATDDSDAFAFEATGSYATKVAFGHADRRIAVAGGPKPDPYHLASNTSDEKPEATSLAFFDGASGERVGEVANAHQGDIAALAGNPSLNGPAFMSVGRQGDVRFWSFQGEPLGTPTRLDINQVGFQVSLSAFSPNGRYAALAWWGGSDQQSPTYQIWDTETLAPLRTPTRVRGELTAIGFAPNADIVAFAVHREHETHIDVTSLSGEPIGMIPILSDTRIEALTFDPKGDVLIASGSGFGIRRWQVGPGELLDLANSRSRLLDLDNQLTALNKASNEALKNYDWNTVAGLMEKGRDLDPENMSIRNMLGNAYQYMQPPQFTEAAQEYDLAIKLNPYYPISHLQRGRLRLKTGDYAGAAEDFTAGFRLSAVTLRPPPQIPGSLDLNAGLNAWGWVNQQGGALEYIRSRGRAYLAVAKWAEAEADFTTAIEGTPELRAAQKYGLQRATFLNYQEMASNFRAALADPITNKTPELRELRARARIELQKYDDAILDLRAAIDLLDDPAQGYSDDDAYGGKMDDPAWRKQKQAALHAQLASIHETRKDSEAAKSERRAALAALDKAHELAPKDWSILIDRGIAKFLADLPQSE